jgi:hypothetical protein
VGGINERGGVVVAGVVGGDLTKGVIREQQKSECRSLCFILSK